MATLKYTAQLDRERVESPKLLPIHPKLVAYIIQN
jgi:hypothetical protein